MSIHTRLRGMVGRRLASSGKDGMGSPLVIKRVIQGVYDPETSEVVNTEEIYKSSGLRVAIKHYFVDGTLVKDEDVNLYISPLSKQVVIEEDEEGEEIETEVDVDTPKILPTDIIIFDEQEYSVVTTRPWNHSGLSAGFKVHARVAG